MRMAGIKKTSARKRPTNVSVDTELLREARLLGINLSQMLEERLAEIVREVHRERWLAENRHAIEDYNRRIQERGTFSDALRRF